MKISKQQKRHILAVLLISAASFLIQDINVLSGFSAKCSLYQYNINCATFGAFVLNKFIRLVVMLSIFFYADRMLLRVFYGQFFNGTILFAILLFGLDMYLCFKGGLFALKMHHLLNTLLYSPLLVIVYIITFAQTKIK
jgi:hypothetical protein